MALSDVWRSYRKDANVYHKGTFENVPQSPGIYAWFYPLRLSGDDLSEFVREINTVFSFDAKLDGVAQGSGVIPFCWNEIEIEARLTSTFKKMPNKIEREWGKILENPQAESHFKKMLLRSSVLMPPLYVGKTIDLKRRCNEHLGSRYGDNSENSFCSRFAKFALEKSIRSRQVSELLFLTIDTQGETVDSCFEENLEDVLEEVMKRICEPSFSKL